MEIYIIRIIHFEENHRKEGREKLKEEFCMFGMKGGSPCVFCELAYANYIYKYTYISFICQVYCKKIFFRVY